jgi:hypothetical protein
MANDLFRFILTSCPDRKFRGYFTFHISKVSSAAMFDMQKL